MCCYAQNFVYKQRENTSYMESQEFAQNHNSLIQETLLVLDLITAETESLLFYWENSL